MTKIQRTPDDLMRALDEQLRLLCEYADQYDAGKFVMAKPMATALRVLCHESKTSKSLLGQLNLKDRYFYDTSTSPDERPPDFDYKKLKLVGSFLGIIGMTHTAELVPYLDSQENRRFFGFSQFDNYWNRIILLDGHKIPFSRKDICLSVANQDGGAHVDSALNAEYRALTRDNSMMIIGRKGGVFHDLNHIASALLRQITHEILRTFLIDYPEKKQIAPAGHPVFTMRLAAKQDNPLEHPPSRVSYGRQKPGRNDPCPCRSGKKYKTCHGKLFNVY